VLLEAEDPVFELGKRVEVCGGEDFPLKDREEDLDLVEPAGMLGKVD
jgi:hypothetical protein